MFIVYHDIRTEARTAEILEFAKEMGNTYFVSYSLPRNICDINMIHTGKRSYFSFLWYAIIAISRVKPEVIILHDNYCAILLPWIKRIVPSAKIIYDSSELYIEPNSSEPLLVQVANIILKGFEKNFLKLCDIVVAANIERANIMRRYFRLRETPIVFDNIHRIDEPFDEDACEKQYAPYLKEDAFCIVYGGGVHHTRMTYELASAVGSLGPRFRLIIAGASTQIEQEKFALMLKRNNYYNVYYIGFIPRNHWKFLLNKADASIVAFLQNTLNNIYCASGKMYESFFEGTPILATENPPLKKICRTYGVGVSNNNFIEGIIELTRNYNNYRKNVEKFRDNIDMNKRKDDFLKIILKKLQIDNGDANENSNY